MALDRNIEAWLLVSRNRNTGTWKLVSKLVRLFRPHKTIHQAPIFEGAPFQRKSLLAGYTIIYFYNLHLESKLHCCYAHQTSAGFTSSARLVKANTPREISYCASFHPHQSFLLYEVTWKFENFDHINLADEEQNLGRLPSVKTGRPERQVDRIRSTDLRSICYWLNYPWKDDWS